MFRDHRARTSRDEVGSETGKRAAGQAALGELDSGMRIGLGTGSTVHHFLDALGEALTRGDLRNVRGVPTSEATQRRALELGIPLLELHEARPLDLAVDGADEVDPRMDLIKGLGGALLREKMVVQDSHRFVVIVDEGKEVPRLGLESPLPVEVVPFGWESHLPFFRGLGAEPRLRMEERGPYRTDNGNLMVDLRFLGGIGNVEEIGRELERRAGVVESGLFLGVASIVLVGRADGGVTRRTEPE
jgi:ribose 5-phosphate isomerase A